LLSIRVLKHKTMKTLFPVAAISLLLLASCGAQKSASSSTSAVQEGVEPMQAEEIVAPVNSSITMQDQESSKNQFAINLYRAVSQSEKGKNVVVSPFSAGVALSMLMEGAGTSTKQEIRSVLSGAPYSDLKIEGDENVNISSANSVWLRNGITLKKDYSSILGKSYSAQLYQRDFTSGATVGEINRWCSDNTNGKIPSIIDRIDPTSVMYLINALYFKAPWMYPFKKSDTTKMMFHGDEGDARIDFMHIEKSFNYTEYEGNQIVRLDYKGGRYYMLICLPSKDASLDMISQYITAHEYDQAKDYMRSRKVILSLPKFKLEGEMLLNSVLQSMGIKEAFTAKADFSNMTDAPVCVDVVKQKTFIEVSEEGTEAAAVTSIGMRLTSVGPRPDTSVVMTIDRPFVFAIVDGYEDNILFMGNIRNLK